MLSAAVDNVDIFLGRIVKPFGIKGELKFVASDDFWGGVFSSEVLFGERRVGGDVMRQPIRVDRARVHGNNFVVKLEGIDDRNAAEEIVGIELFINSAEIDVDTPEEELPYQIIGSSVHLENGDLLGTVTNLVFSAAHDVYEVRREDESVLLIPAIPEFVVGRDPDKRKITIRPIPGLIDG